MNCSIITPSYNQGQFIEQTIDSVLSQGIATLEYIIIDGGSTDETLSILEKYQNQIDFISEKDGGQADALNKGFKKAAGDIIGWLNSDDIYYPETLSYVLDFFESHSSIDILYGGAYHIDAKNKIINQYPTEAWNLKKLMQRCYISQPAVFFRRAVFDRAGFLDRQLQYCMDYEFWLRCATVGLQFYYDPTILAATRLHADAKTVVQSVSAHREQMRVIKRYRSTVPLRMRLAYLYSLIKRF